MKRTVLVLMGTLVAGFALWLSPATLIEGMAQKDKLRRSEIRIPGRYIVVLEDWAAGTRGQGSHAESLAAEFATAYQAKVDHVFKNALSGFSVEMSERQAEALSHDPRVKYIEEDGLMYASATQSNATWGLDRIDQRNLPLNATYNYDATGSGVRAYIIDTGIRTSHNEFGGRASGAFSSINDGNGTSDCNGHGTHVAGTVGGTTYGVAKNVTLIAVRVLNCQGSGTTSGVIAGVDWVTANHVEPAVANMSLGGSASSSLDAAVNNSIAAGVIYAVAAGNSNANACNYSPARAANAITVGSTTSSDARSSFSNFGSCVDLFAPGSSITSAWSTSNTAINTISGTSMASPHVAGVAALYLEANPAASPSAVAAAINSNATTGKVTSAGSGSPNRLLYSIFDGTSPEPSPTPDPSGITLSAVGYKVKGVIFADLTWAGAAGTNVEIYRNNTQIVTANDGIYTDSTGQRGGGSNTYKVCETGGSPCSDPVTLSY